MVVPDKTDPAEDPVLQAELSRVRAWSAASGQALTEEIARKLRSQLHYAVVEHIPWGTSLRRLPTWVSRQSGRFRLSSFQIDKAPSPTPGTDQITIKIAATPENAAVLSDVLRFAHHGHWRFPGGAKAFVQYQQQVEAWATTVIDALLPEVGHGLAGSGGRGSRDRRSRART